MLTSPSILESDPRTMCGIIAKTALTLIDAPKDAVAASEAVEATWLRIMEMYKYGAFRHTGIPRGMFDSTPINQPWAPQPGDPGAELEKAILRVHKEMQPDKSGEEFAATIAAAVTACFGTVQQEQPDCAAKRTELRRFLELFRNAVAQP